jgi:hypothetical protein
MLKEKQQRDQAKLAMHEYYWKRTAVENIYESARTQRRLVEEYQRAQKAYEVAYAKDMRRKFLDLDEEDDNE